METVLFESVCWKRLKVTVFETLSNFAPFPPPNFGENLIFKFFTDFLFIKLGLAKISLVLVHSFSYERKFQNQSFPKKP